MELESIKGLGGASAKKLKRAGIKDVKALAKANLEKVAKKTKISKKLIKKWMWEAEKLLPKRKRKTVSAPKRKIEEVEDVDTVEVAPVRIERSRIIEPTPESIDELKSAVHELSTLTKRNISANTTLQIKVTDMLIKMIDIMGKMQVMIDTLRNMAAIQEKLMHPMDFTPVMTELRIVKQGMYRLSKQVESIEGYKRKEYTEHLMRKVKEKF
jgi:hypothetical protein